MADDDDVSGGFLDPSGLRPSGTAYTMGNPDQSIDEWVRNLHPDDLAKVLQNHPEAIQDLAAKGIGPPSPTATDQMHSYNNDRGTPSKSDRFITQPDPTNPLNGPTYPTDAFGTVRQDTRGRIVGNLSDYPQPPPQSAPPPAQNTDPTRSIYMSGGPPRERMDPSQQPSSSTGTLNVPNVFKEQPAVPSGRAPAERQQPRPGEEATGAHRLPGKDKPYPVTVPVEVPKKKEEEKPKEKPAETKPPGEDIAGPAETVPLPRDRPTQEKIDADTREGHIKDAIDSIGKAMQGVKAPEPLKPPGSFAPAPHPTAAPSIANIIAALGQARAGQVPASAMPVLKLLGRA